MSTFDRMWVDFVDDAKYDDGLQEKYDVYSVYLSEKREAMDLGAKAQGESAMAGRAGAVIKKASTGARG